MGALIREFSFGKRLARSLKPDEGNPFERMLMAQMTSGRAGSFLIRRIPCIVMQDTNWNFAGAGFTMVETV
jgi:hypothetical protein